MRTSLRSRFPRRGKLKDVSDEKLAARIKQGDSRAWAELLQRYTDFIYTKAIKYSQTGHLWTSKDDLADEVSNLYLFMLEHLKKSFASFKGRCKAKTWIFSIINDRKQIIKTYLLQKYPHRADVRLPKVIRNRPDIDRKVFKRLIWGLLPDHIAWDLSLDEVKSEEKCEEILALLKEKSPRVHERLMENRLANLPNVSLDQLMEKDEGKRPYEPLSRWPTPEEELSSKESRQIVRDAVQRSLNTLSEDEKRLLLLLYDQEMTPAEIAKSANVLCLPEINRDKQVYYRRDKALRKMMESIERRLRELKLRDLDFEKPAMGRKTLDSLEEVLRERGVSGIMK